MASEIKSHTEEAAEGIGRRAVIRSSLGLVGAGMAGLLLEPGRVMAATSEGKDPPRGSVPLAQPARQVPTSANGWPIVQPEERAWTPPWRVGGSDITVNLRLDWYPPGSQGNFSDHQLVVLRDIVAECEGVVRWGGDDKQPNESRIVIDAPPGDERLLRVAAKIRAWDDTPGQGAGTAVNPFDSKRRKAARAFQSRRELD